VTVLRYILVYPGTATERLSGAFPLHGYPGSISSHRNPAHRTTGGAERETIPGHAGVSSRKNPVSQEPDRHVPEEDADDETNGADAVRILV